MPKLAHLTEKLDAVREKLAEAGKATEIRQSQLDTLLDDRFNKVSDRLEGAINRLMTESDKIQDRNLTKALGSFGKDVLKAVSDSNGVFRQGLSQISQEVALSHNILTDELAKIVIDGSLAGRIDSVGKAVGEIRIPEQKETDLTGVLAAISAFEVPDISPQLRELQNRLDKRVHSFDVIRDPLSGLIDKIVVTEA